MELRFQSSIFLSKKATNKFPYIDCSRLFSSLGSGSLPSGKAEIRTVISWVKKYKGGVRTADPLERWKQREYIFTSI
jgi:hypothetical protein